MTSVSPAWKRMTWASSLPTKRNTSCVEIRKAILALVSLPVIRIAFEHDLLAGNVLFQTKRPHAGNFGRRRGEGPHLGELTFFIGLFQQVPRHHCQAIEDSLGGGIGLSQRETNRVLINFLHVDWLSAYD